MKYEQMNNEPLPDPRLYRNATNEDNLNDFEFVLVRIEVEGGCAWYKHLVMEDYRAIIERLPENKRITEGGRMRSRIEKGNVLIRKFGDEENSRKND